MSTECRNRSDYKNHQAELWKKHTHTNNTLVLLCQYRKSAYVTLIKMSFRMNDKGGESISQTLTLNPNPDLRNAVLHKTPPLTHSSNLNYSESKAAPAVKPGGGGVAEGAWPSTSHGERAGNE